MLIKIKEYHSDGTEKFQGIIYEINKKKIARQIAASITENFNCVHIEPLNKASRI